MKNSFSKWLIPVLAGLIFLVGCGDPGGTDIPGIVITNAQTPEIIVQPQSRPYNPGTSPENILPLEVTAQVTDGGGLTYQWYKADSETGLGTEIENANGSEYTPVIPNTVEPSTWYYVVVTNTNNAVNGRSTADVTSNRAEISLTNDVITDAETPVITVPPVGAEYEFYGDAPIATLTVTADPVSDGGTLSYLWYAADSAEADGVAIPDATGDSYTPVKPDSIGVSHIDTWYWVVVTNTNNEVNGNKIVSVDSAKAKITILAPSADAQTPDITVQPVGASYSTFVGGSAADLFVAAEVTDGGTLSFQWYSADNATADGSVIANATTDTYTPPITSTGTVYYSCVVTNTNNAATGAKIVTVRSERAAIIVSTGLPLVYKVNEDNAFVGTFTTGQTVETYIENGAYVVTDNASNNAKSVNTGDGGYIDLGGTVGNILKNGGTGVAWTIELYAYIPSNYSFSGAGHHLFGFGENDNYNSGNGEGGGSGATMWLTGQSLGLNIRSQGWSGNAITSVAANGGASNIPGRWRHIVMVIPASNTADRVLVYMDGNVIGTGTRANNTRFSTLGQFYYGYLGRSIFYGNGDNPLRNAQYYQFAVYQQERSAAQILEDSKTILYSLNGSNPPISGVTFVQTAGLQESLSNTAAGAIAGTFTTQGGFAPYTYALASGNGSTDNGLFTINGSNLVVGNTALTAGSKAIRVTATDSTGVTSTQQFTLTVLPATLVPLLDLTFSSSAIVNNVTTGYGAAQGTLSYVSTNGHRSGAYAVRFSTATTGKGTPANHIRVYRNNSGTNALLQNTHTEFTVEYWMRRSVTNTDSNSWLFYIASSETQPGYGTSTERYIGNLYQRVQDNSTTSARWIKAERYYGNSGRNTAATSGALQSAQNGIPNNNDDWTHVAYVFTPTTSYLYINGSQVASGGAGTSPASLGTILGNSSAFYIGRAQWEGGEGSYHDISRFRVYTTALGAPQIQTLFNETN